VALLPQDEWRDFDLLFKREVLFTRLPARSDERLVGGSTDEIGRQSCLPGCQLRTDHFHPCFTAAKYLNLPGKQAQNV
jgi:hypothetical protein